SSDRRPYKMVHLHHSISSPSTVRSPTIVESKSCQPKHIRSSKVTAPTPPSLKWTLQWFCGFADNLTSHASNT
ncbi:hypothetical protein AVEN_122497-1, partial [Araneus ventricosus]